MGGAGESRHALAIHGAGYRKGQAEARARIEQLEAQLHLAEEQRRQAWAYGETVKREALDVLADVNQFTVQLEAERDAANAQAARLVRQLHDAQEDRDVARAELEDVRGDLDACRRKLAEVTGERDVARQMAEEWRLEAEDLIQRIRELS